MQHGIGPFASLQFARGRDADRRRPAHPQADQARVGAGLGHEVIFQLAVIVIEQQIDSRIDLPVTQAGVGRQIPYPVRRIVAQEVVQDSGLPVERLDRRARVGAYECNTLLDGVDVVAAAGQDTEHKSVALEARLERLPARLKEHAFRSLAAVGCEGHRPAARHSVRLPDKVWPGIRKSL